MKFVNFPIPTLRKGSLQGPRIPPALPDLLHSRPKTGSSCVKSRQLADPETQESCSRLSAVHISECVLILVQEGHFKNRALASAPCTFWDLTQIPLFENRALASTPCIFQSVDYLSHQRPFSRIVLSPGRRAHFQVFGHSPLSEITLSPRRRAYFQLTSIYLARPDFRKSRSRLDAVHISGCSVIDRFNKSSSRLEAVHIFM